MNDARVACTACGAKLPDDLTKARDFLPCPTCQELLRIFAFPALRRPIVPAAALPVTGEGEASCFYHPQKRAAVVCDSCGRFLCALCDIEIGAAHRCPACLEAEKRKGTAGPLQTRGILWDNVALLLATVPILFWPITLFTAPAAIFVAIRYWRRPLSVVRRTRVRFVLALLLALAQLLGWLLLVYFAISSLVNRTG